MTKVGLRKGAWTAEEDDLLKQCIQTYGEGNWYLIPDRAGLKRCRKSCRMRWLNYLKPGINRGELEEDEVDLILRLHKVLGNKWSLIAGRLPGRTCSNIKNYWYTYIAKKLPKPAAESIISQGNNKKQQEEEEEDLVKVKAIRPIARRPTKTMQFDMNVTSDQPPPPLHGGIIAEENWWKRLVEDDKNYYGFHLGRPLHHRC